MAESARKAGRILAEAWRSGTKIASLGELRPASRHEAFATQDAMAVEIGLPIAGWKVGAATPAILEQRGLEDPIPGPLYEPCVHTSPARLPASEFRESNLESEFAFRALVPLPPRPEGYNGADLRKRVVAHAAFDLTQTRFSEAPDELSEIADSGNSGGAVIGPEIEGWHDLELRQAAVELRISGGVPVPVYAGRWRRDPLDVLRWLLNSLGRRGIGLEAGAYVLTGSVTEPRPMRPGSTAVAVYGNAGEVRARIREAE